MFFSLCLVLLQPRTFAQAFAAAHLLLGPNRTFMWNGGEYSTSRPDGRDLSSKRLRSLDLAASVRTAQRHEVRRRET